MNLLGENNPIENIINQSSILFIFLFVSFFICYIIYLASTNDFSFKTNSLYYFSAIIIPVVTLFLYILYKYTLEQEEIILLYITLGFVLSVTIIAYIFTYSGLSYYIFNPFFLNSITFLIVIIGLSIVFNIFADRFKKVTGWMGFFINLIFYIPCLISDFIQYIIKEYKQTSTTTFILFIIEILLIIFYLYLFPLIRSSINANALVLLDSPVMLSTEIRIDSILKEKKFDQLEHLPNKSSHLVNPNKVSTSVMNQKFGLSMWVYINPLSATKTGYSKETNIFNYGSINGDRNNHHPQIVHLIGNDGNNIRFYLTNNETYDTTIPYQKWNNIVLNYNNNSIDIFINGILKHNYMFSNDQPIFQDSDIMIVGTDNGNINNDGIYGSICNVVYYKYPMTNMDIINNYNLLMYNNPPTI